MGVRGVLIACLLVVLATGVAHADARSEAVAQVEFGIAVARRNLWKEARYRWERAVAIDPTYAAAYNNLAVAYERTGEFDKAREAYERAVEIEPNNLMIQQNFDLFREINDRTSTSLDR
jgi:Tfp pilus assembly protein PilF